MKEASKDRWFSGEGLPVTFEEMMLEIDEYVSSGGKVFVGTDSQLKSDCCVFVVSLRARE